MKDQQPKYSNELVNESSPYLLQHAHNPVNWHAWNEKSLEKAKSENKLILVSVGYSACHWCHVMEHESFEDETVAQIMNDHFICIKVDREERPDIDQVYMMAVQLMTGRGGWPLNCFALPDGRPIYGGTYFQKQQWINVLLNLADLYTTEPDKVLEYAVQLTEGVKLAELVKENSAAPEFSEAVIKETYKNWKIRFDRVYGGPDKAPKFPLPNNYQFLLRLSFSKLLSEKESEELREHVRLTLRQMAYGGIYDQLGGGFARYSVDGLWKVPHFEKMLYDNAQLVSLYSEAYTAMKDPLYKEVVFQTLDFIRNELSAADGGFYSALDADSEKVEGKFYVWKKEELEVVPKHYQNIFSEYYNINEHGYWEDENYILLRRDDDDVIAAKHKMSVPELKEMMQTCRSILMKERNKRIRPGLDNKILTSWNALMIKAYADASIAFSEPSFLETAVAGADFILKRCVKEDNRVLHLAGKEDINGFLEDYCFLAEALITLYQATLKESYLYRAADLLEYCRLHFRDEKSGMFYFTSDLDPALIVRKMELTDNVIPASNSSIAKVMFLIGHYFGKPAYIEESRKMLHHVQSDIPGYGAGYSNWGILYLQQLLPFYELAIVGKAVNEKLKELQQHYFPNLIFAGSNAESELPLLRNRFNKDKTLIYVCRDMACSQPEEEVSEALKHLFQD